MAKVFRACTTRKIGVAAAAVLASISVVMVVHGANFLAHRPGAYEELQREASDAADPLASSTIGANKWDKSEPFMSAMKVKPAKTNHNLIEEKQDTPARSVKWREPVVVLDVSKSTTPRSAEKLRKRSKPRDGAGSGLRPSRPVGAPKSPAPSVVLPPASSPHSPPAASLPFVPYEPDLPNDHMCAKFAYPPPATNKRKTGFRPCAVCYLPLEASIAAMPPPREIPSEVVRDLTYVNKDDEAESAASQGGVSKFGGHPTWEDRKASFDVKEKMHVHCGFVPGQRPGDGTGFDFSEDDRKDMDACRGVVVASAIFGSYDVLNQPSHISERSKKEVCFFMFLDPQTHDDFVADGTLPSPDTRKVGLWRIVRVANIPYSDPRRTGKIPKLLLHRLFPNARFSLWVDGKLELVVDPYRVLERFLWRHNDTWAISRHYKRFDVFVEAEANKAAGKYQNASIDEQMEVYRNEGMLPYSEAKLPITSDVPEGCMIIREHTPITNLMGCLWFNEVDRFTSRDQLSFGFVRDKLMQHAQFRLTMFQDCERRNFVVQKYHKELLLARAESKLTMEVPALPPTTDTGSLGSRRDKRESEAESLLGVPVVAGARRVLQKRMVDLGRASIRGDRREHIQGGGKRGGLEQTRRKRL